MPPRQYSPGGPRPERVHRPPFYRPTTSIHQLAEPEQFTNLLNHNHDPEDRLTNLFIATILRESGDQIRRAHTHLSNRILDSFLVSAFTYLENAADDIRDIWEIMYENRRPHQELYDMHISKVCDRLRNARNAVTRNDPQLCMSILYNITIGKDEIDDYQVEEQALDTGYRYGPTAQEPHYTRYLLLDSSTKPDRFLCHPAFVAQCVSDLLRTGIDGHNEDVNPSILLRQSNLHARGQDALALETRITNDINAVLRSRQNSRSRLRAVLSYWIDIWSSRSLDRNYRHADLPLPRIRGSVNYHRTATTEHMLLVLSDACRNVRRAYDAVGRHVPRRLTEFIAENPAPRGILATVIDQRGLLEIVTRRGDDEA